jgi:O-antigen ligase
VKWALLIAALACVPYLADWIRRNPAAAPKLWMTIGFLIVQHSPLHLFMAIVSWAGMWPGYVEGLEISLVDIILLAVYLTLPRRRQPTPFVVFFGIYFAAVLLSAAQARVPFAAIFYAWQLARVFFVYLVISRACAADDRVTLSLLKGLAMGLFLAAAQAAWQRFVLGLVQTPGSFGHQNFLGLISHFIVFPFFALLLVDSRSKLPRLVSIVGAVVAVLTTSRATVAFAGLGFVSVFALSALRKWTSQKTRVAMIGAAALLAILPLFLSSFESRFGANVEASFLAKDEERVQLTTAASMMLGDHPMGVGANHYVVVANAGGYNARVGLSWTSNSAHVHNVYWLIAAETGYVGLFTFVAMLLRPLVVAFACGWRNRNDVRGDLLLGLGVSLLMVYLHCFYEWIFITFQAQYIFAASMGLIAGLAQQLGYFRTRVPQRIRAHKKFESTPERAPTYPGRQY